MRKRFVRVLNWLFEIGLSPIELLVYVVLLALDTSENGCVCASAAKIGNRCGLHRNSVTTAVKRLCEMGILEKSHTYAANGNWSRNCYRILVKAENGEPGFTRVSVALTGIGLTPAQFAVYCYLKKCANRQGWAFCGYNKMAAGAKVCQNTALAAVSELEQRGLVWKKHYTRVTGAFGCNNYFVADEPMGHIGRTPAEHKKLSRWMPTLLLASWKQCCTDEKILPVFPAPKAPPPLLMPPPALSAKQLRAFLHLHPPKNKRRKRGSVYESTFAPHAHPPDTS